MIIDPAAMPVIPPGLAWCLSTGSSLHLTRGDNGHTLCGLRVSQCGHPTRRQWLCGNCARAPWLPMGGTRAEPPPEYPQWSFRDPI